MGIGLVLAAGASVGAWVFLEPPFNAFAQIQVATVPPWVLHPKIDTPEHRNEFMTYQKLQAAQIRGRRVLNAALVRPEIKSLEIVKQQPDPLLWLEDQIRTESKENDEVMTIAMTGMDPDACRSIVNGVREAYFEEVVKVERKGREDRLKELEKIVDEAEQALRKKKDQYNELADRMGSSDPGVLSIKQQNLMTTLIDKRRQMNMVQWEARKAEARLKALQEFQANLAQQPPMQPMTSEPMKEMEAATVSEAAITDAVNRDPQVKDFTAKLRGAEQHLARCKEHLYEGDPTLSKARKHLEEARAALDQRKKGGARGSHGSDQSANPASPGPGCPHAACSGASRHDQWPGHDPGAGQGRGCGSQPTAQGAGNRGGRPDQGIRGF